MEPFFTNDAVVLGMLLIVLAGIFYTSSLETDGWKKFYTYVPSLLLCYFLPALLHWPLGLIASDWFDNSLIDFLAQKNLSIPEGASYSQIEQFLTDNNISKEEIAKYKGHSRLYFMASRYLLPASLILLCISIDFKGIMNLGPKALIMFFTATLGIVIGGPIALLVVLNIAPNILSANSLEIANGLSTVAGSWIGGGANQTAMKEIYLVPDNLFATMIIVDVVVANIWMGFLLYGANITKRIDNYLGADVTAIEALKTSIADYRASIAEIPTTTKLFVMLAVAFGGVALSHWGADSITPFMKRHAEFLKDWKLNSLMSGFFWMIVISTTVGLLLSFTKARKLEGIGASRWGSIFIYVLVATIGMHMNIGEIWDNLGLFAIGIIWMLVHVILLLTVAKIIKAPFFFVAVGSQANVGGAASAPIVASAFSPSLAPVGVLLAVLGYALGTYGAIICAEIMRSIAGG